MPARAFEGIGIALAILLTQSATAMTFEAGRISNPFGFVLSDAEVDVPVPATLGRRAPGWSVKVAGQVLPAQYMPDRSVVRFVLPLKAHESVEAVLVPKAVPAAPRRVQVTLKVQQGGGLKKHVLQGGIFLPQDVYIVPASHFLHDGLIAFEGIGWESDRVAYRLYLDRRNVTDLFGKYGPGMIFQDVGLGFDDYQYPRAWGGDIYKVGDALGVGGIGLLRHGRATQTGKAVISAERLANGPVTAVARVNADRIDGGAGFIHARYAITAGSTLTRVSVQAGHLPDPLVTGLTVHPGDSILHDHDRAEGDSWRYIAVWGPQEHGPDPVGTAVFYRAEDVSGAPQNDGATLFIRFRAPDRASYAFAGRWSQEGKHDSRYPAVKTKAEFTKWLRRTCRRLENPVKMVRNQAGEKG